MSYDQLAFAYFVYADRAQKADRSCLACSRAMAARDRVGDEVHRRGAVIRPSSNGGYLVGPPSWFAPIWG